MYGLRTLVRRVRALFQDGRLDEELQFHLEMETERLVRSGMRPEAARLAARRNFGGVEQVKEIYRDRRGLPAVETLARDLAHAASRIDSLLSQEYPAGEPGAAVLVSRGGTIVLKKGYGLGNTERRAPDQHPIEKAPPSQSPTRLRQWSD